MLTIKFDYFTYGIEEIAHISWNLILFYITVTLTNKGLFFFM